MKSIVFLLLVSLTSLSSCVIYYPAGTYSYGQYPPRPMYRSGMYHGYGGYRYGNYQGRPNYSQYNNGQLGQWRNGLYYPYYTPPNASFNTPAYPNRGQQYHSGGNYRRR